MAKSLRTKIIAPVMAGLMAVTSVAGIGGCGKEAPKFTERVDGKFKGYDVVTYIDDSGGRRMIIGDFNINEHGYIVSGKESIEAADRDLNGKFEYSSYSPIMIPERHPLKPYVARDSLEAIYNLLFVKP